MLVVYAPQKIEGQALCRLLRRRSLNPQLFQKVGADLLENARFGKIGVIILDLSSLPDIDEDIEVVLEMAQDVPVIMLTPYVADAPELQPYQRRGYHTLEKPIVMERLLSLVQKLAPDSFVQ